MKRLICISAGAAIAALLILCGVCVWAHCLYRRPCREVAEASGLPPSLVYAVIKAESGFREDARSSAGAVGLMQLLPSTAEFVCRKEGKTFYPERLTEGSYNVELGCAYLRYLFGRFKEERAVLAAYNAGEGAVRDWLSQAGTAELREIPYPETARYVKKVEKFRKIYDFFYD